MLFVCPKCVETSQLYILFYYAFPTRATQWRAAVPTIGSYETFHVAVAVGGLHSHVVAGPLE
jgi:hypothetical protein